MQSLAHTLREIEGWLGATGRPYRIWNNEWISDGGLVWDYPLVPLSELQIAAFNKVITRAVQSLAGRVFVSTDDYELAMRNAYLAEASELDHATWQFGHQYMAEPDGMSTLRRQRERTFRRIRRIAKREGLTAYKTRLSWEGVSSTSFDAIVVAPLATQYDILRTEGTVGNDHYRTTDGIVDELRSFDKDYGVIISGADTTALEFWFKRAPKGEEAREVGERLLQLAPDIREMPTAFRTCVALWWD
jgi:hypothetical protein